MPDDAPGEKTEDPTPKRKREAREEGQVAKSQELSQAFTLLGGFLLLTFLLKDLLFSLQTKVANLIELNEIPVLTPENSFTILMENIYFIVDLTGPVMVAAAALGALINFVQIGPLFSVKSIQPKFSNIDPVSGLKNIFSMKTLVELIKSLLKAAAIVVIAYIYFKGFWDDLVTMPLQGLYPSLMLIGNLIFKIGLSVVIFLIVLGVADFAYQKWDHYQDLKMTKYEVKQERKEMEGDPQIKEKRQERQREMSANRMMSEMEDADVVVTNPTHIAVALEYKMEAMEAPVVVAKGEGQLAQRIKDKAKELDIEIVEEKSLARALNKTTAIGEEIPADLYQAVAEILAYIYNQNDESWE